MVVQPKIVAVEMHIEAGRLEISVGGNHGFRNSDIGKFLPHFVPLLVTLPNVSCLSSWRVSFPTCEWE